MTSIINIERRLAALEDRQVQQDPTPEQQRASLLASAAAVGLTEPEVVSRFGGWPAFVYEKVIKGVFAEQPGPWADSMRPHERWLRLIRG